MFHPGEGENSQNFTRLWKVTFKLPFPREAPKKVYVRLVGEEEGNVKLLDSETETGEIELPSWPMARIFWSPEPFSKERCLYPECTQPRISSKLGEGCHLHLCESKGCESKGCESKGCESKGCESKGCENEIHQAPCWNLVAEGKTKCLPCSQYL